MYPKLSFLIFLVTLITMIRIVPDRCEEVKGVMVLKSKLRKVANFVKVLYDWGTKPIERIDYATD